MPQTHCKHRISIYIIFLLPIKTQVTWVETLKLEQRVWSRCLCRSYPFPCTSSCGCHTCTYILGALRSHTSTQLHWISWHSPAMSNPKHNGREKPCTRVVDVLQHLIEDLSQDAVLRCCAVLSALLSCVFVRSCCSFSLVFFEVKFLDCSNRKNITNFSQ